MTALRKDVLKALSDWKAGKPVRALELGHVHRMKENPGSSPLIDMSQHLHQDQDRAYAYCFHIIEHFAEARTATFEEFSVVCDGLERDFREENKGLTEEELHGAESLAWKALLFGWARAIDGHKDANYIEVTRPAKQESAT